MAIVIKEIKVVSTVEKRIVSEDQLSQELIHKIRSLIQEEGQRQDTDKSQSKER